MLTKLKEIQTNENGRCQLIKEEKEEVWDKKSENL